MEKEKEKKKESKPAAEKEEKTKSAAKKEIDAAISETKFRPKETCSDSHCPFHGGARVRGRTFTGKVMKDVFHKTATIEFPRLFFIPKYDRYEKRRTRIKVHVPSCIAIKPGSVIKIGETRPISKTKNFVVVDVIKE